MCSWAGPLGGRGGWDLHLLCQDKGSTAGPSTSMPVQGPVGGMDLGANWGGGGSTLEPWGQGRAFLRVCPAPGTGAGETGSMVENRGGKHPVPAPPSNKQGHRTQMSRACWGVGWGRGWGRGLAGPGFVQHGAAVKATSWQLCAVVGRGRRGLGKAVGGSQSEPSSGW